MNQPLHGQNAIVTGGDSGIGAAMVIALAKAGASVGINYRGSADDSDYVTGAALFVDGGMSLYPGFHENG